MVQFYNPYLCPLWQSWPVNQVRVHVVVYISCCKHCVYTGIDLHAQILKKPRFKHKMPPARTDIESPNHDEKSVLRRNSSHGDNSAKFTNERKPSTAALLRNPLIGMTREQLIADADAFVDEKGLSEYREAFRKGALIAQVMNTSGGFEHVHLLNEEEKTVLRREITNKWSQPFMLYFLCTLCAGSAIVQGMDQTAVNGAQVRPSNGCTKPGNC